jgi:hypothetical protein
MGADVNANIGRIDALQSSKFHSTIGPHGFSKQNSKGEGLLTVYFAHQICVMNTFFEGKSNGPGFGTWTSNRPTGTQQAESHMLDLIVCSTSLHKRVRNCYTAPDRLNSNHRAVRMHLNLTSLKYKDKSTVDGGTTDWRKICKDDKHQKLYNKYLLD